MAIDGFRQLGGYSLLQNQGRSTPNGGSSWDLGWGLLYRLTLLTRLPLSF